MKKIIVSVILAITLFSCSKQANNNLRHEQSRRNNGHGHHQTEATLAVMTLTHVSGNTFSIDYGGATDAIRVFLRSGDSLYSNGNLYPANAQLYIPAPVGSFTTWVSGAMYQAVIITGTEERDANGILGTNWQFTYTNIVQ